MRIASMSKKQLVVRTESLIFSMQLLPACDRRSANCSCSRLSDEIHSGEEHIGGIVSQTPTSDKTREPDASALERGSELDEQIFRLQCLVSHLLEKNEELRQRLARQASGRAEVYRAEVGAPLRVQQGAFTDCREAFAKQP
jgi:hypothetical protein